MFSMNISAYPAMKKILYSIFFYNCIHIIFAFIVFKLVISQSCVYYFRTNENSEILFSEEENAIIEAEKKEFNLILFPDVDSGYQIENKHVFTYKKENFVQFEVLNNLLTPNLLEKKSQNGIIVCSFELVYFLKISSDISEISNKFNIHFFKCMLLTFKVLRAVENKKLLKFLQALLIINFIFENNKKKSVIDFDLKEVFNCDFLTEIDSYIKKNLILAFLNIFMMKYIFFDGNLILLENTNIFNDMSLLNRHIPYKSLLINNYNIFCSLENSLKNPNISFIFLNLLNEINIKSLVINNCQGFEIPNSKFNFSLFSIIIFKSITISNFDSSSSSFLFGLNAFIQDNIEYLTLKNLLIPRDILHLLLNKPKLKGLVLYNVNIMGFPLCIENFMYSIETLDYIDFGAVDIGYTWWSTFFRRINVSKIILFCRSEHAEKSFMKEFTRINSIMNFTYFSMEFYSGNIPSEFVRVLLFLQHLKTLKLKGYLIEENEEAKLYKAIQSMKELECLEILQTNHNKESLNFKFQTHKIKVLHLENIVLCNNFLIVDFFCNNKSIKKLFLRRIRISALFFKEIFKLENLKTLIMQYCIFEPILVCEPLNLIAKNIYHLDLYGTSLDFIQKFHIFDELDFLEYLYLSFSERFPSYLEKLSVMCNLRLKKLNFEHGVIFPNDLNRIQKLEVLEELNLLNSMFIDCSFQNLGNNCKFFESLVNLNLLFVKITIEDLVFFRNFRNLKRLSIELSAFNIISIRNCVLCLPIIELSTILRQENDKFKKYIQYFNENGIEVV